ncbi:MAG: helix-turn-helix domain-containing protein [Candidatus Nealsonbacteria bacterium]|nr:helix-turn-helix domain-containing protein [Candidatus Nealsonbacteria bacterium]
MSSKLFSIKQVAEMCDVKRHILEYAVSRRMIPGRKIGSHWIFSEKNVQAIREYLRTKRCRQKTVTAT